jgi:hypothetical protein
MLNPLQTKMDDTLAFCPVLAEMVGKKKAVGKTGKVFENLGSMSTLNNLVMLRNVQCALKPQRTLEIGLAFGASCLVFTTTHRDLGGLPSQQHIAIDPFQVAGWDSAGLLAVDRAGLGGYLNFREERSCYELPRLAAAEVECDLIYVDGSHLFENVFIDYFFVSRILRDNGVVIFDDATNAHVRKVLGFITSNGGACLREINLDRFRRDGGKTPRFRVARMLGMVQARAFRKVGDSNRAWDSALGRF